MTIIERCRALCGNSNATSAGIEFFRGKKHVAVIFSDLCREMGMEQERLLLQDTARLTAADVAVIRVYDGKVTPLFAAEPGLRSKTVRSQLDANSVVRFCIAIVDKSGEVKYRAAKPTGGEALLASL